MKLYQKETMKVVRFDIKEYSAKREKKPAKAKGITVMDTTVEEAIKFAEKLFGNKEVTIKIKATEKPPHCSITTYEAVGKTRGNYKSMTVYGLTCDEIFDAITKELS